MLSSREKDRHQYGEDGNSAQRGREMSPDVSTSRKHQHLRSAAHYQLCDQFQHRSGRFDSVDEAPHHAKHHHRHRGGPISKPQHGSSVPPRKQHNASDETHGKPATKQKKGAIRKVLDWL
ncbi:uncharacterized protein EKO05_0001209 [Ascochyta rabiei]|nr:uncharacterized protein EKO05_0001209 [Ascochyta rabiei]UPX10557.1 hypothetical protein EKO05_0001209 [Ascochyta rabiei]